MLPPKDFLYKMPSPITIAGRRLLQDENRFIVRGVIYQDYSYSRWQNGAGRLRDPLSNDHLPSLKRHVSLLKELNINAIRVYHIDSSEPRDQCMYYLAENGIYVIADAGQPGANQCINRINPARSYNEELLRHYYSVIDVMAPFSNTLGICVSNSLFNDRVDPETEAILETVHRDLLRSLKTYMRTKQQNESQRILPLCMSDSDDISRVQARLDLFPKTAVADESVDFFMLTNYEPAPKIDDEDSRWTQMQRLSSETSIPILVTEFGGNQVRPRTFEEVDLLYSDKYLETISGGFVYEFFEGANHYGLVKVDGDAVERLPDLQNLILKFESVKNSSFGQ